MSGYTINNSLGQYIAVISPMLAVDCVANNVLATKALNKGAAFARAKRSCVWQCRGPPKSYECVPFWHGFKANKRKPAILGSPPLTQTHLAYICFPSELALEDAPLVAIRLIC